MKSLYGLMAAFCLLALPSKSFAHGNTAHSTVDSIAVDHGSPPNATAAPESNETSASSNFDSAPPSVSSHGEATITAERAARDVDSLALHRLHDVDRNRAGAQLVYMVKERSRDLNPVANYMAPRRLRHQWRAVLYARPPAGHLAFDQPLFS